MVVDFQILQEGLLHGGNDVNWFYMINTILLQLQQQVIQWTLVIQQ